MEISIEGTWKNFRAYIFLGYSDVKLNLLKAIIVFEIFESFDFEISGRERKILRAVFLTSAKYDSDILLQNVKNVDLSALPNFSVKYAK